MVDALNTPSHLVALAFLLMFIAMFLISGSLILVYRMLLRRRPFLQMLNKPIAVQEAYHPRLLAVDAANVIDAEYRVITEDYDG